MTIDRKMILVHISRGGFRKLSSISCQTCPRSSNIAKKGGIRPRKTVPSAQAGLPQYRTSARCCFPRRRCVTLHLGILVMRSGQMVCSSLRTPRSRRRYSLSQRHLSRVPAARRPQHPSDSLPSSIRRRRRHS